MDVALEQVPVNSGVAAAVRFARRIPATADAVERLHDQFAGMAPANTLDKLALVIWALCSANGEFDAAISDAVAAEWDTDCKGATAGGKCGLMGAPVYSKWTRPRAGPITGEPND